MAAAGNIVREKFTARCLSPQNLFPLHLYSRLKLFDDSLRSRIIIILSTFSFAKAFFEYAIFSIYGRLIFHTV